MPSPSWRTPAINARCTTPGDAIELEHGGTEARTDAGRGGAIRTRGVQLPRLYHFVLTGIHELSCVLASH